MPDTPVLYRDDSPMLGSLNLVLLTELAFFPSDVGSRENVVFVRDVLSDGEMTNWLYPATAEPAGFTVTVPRSEPSAPTAPPRPTTLAVPRYSVAPNV